MDTTEIVAHCVKIIEDADTVHLATLDEKGYPQIRAMLNLRYADQFPGLAGFMKKHAPGLRTFFTTNTSSQKVRQIHANGACSVYYSMGYNGVTVTGQVAIVEDAALKDALWQDGWELYYPGGRADPDYTVLSFTPATVKYFNNLQVHESALP